MSGFVIFLISALVAVTGGIVSALVLYWASSNR